MRGQYKQLDAKEIHLPETLFVRDIESRVFQSIALQCLSKIEGVAVLEANLIDNLLGRDALERVKGIIVEQDSKSHSVNIRLEINVAYGVNIPQKAEEIQIKVAREVSTITGLHCGTVHVVFKNLIYPEKTKLDRESEIEKELVKAARTRESIECRELVAALKE